MKSDRSHHKKTVKSPKKAKPTRCNGFAIFIPMILRPYKSAKSVWMKPTTSFSWTDLVYQGNVTSLRTHSAKFFSTKTGLLKIAARAPKHFTTGSIKREKTKQVLR
ncbi:MAG: hypothetical protein NWS31_03210 [Crocinitomicaceae bacterium]|nr:hypothetical protein [Crocinitomicaceae bacterium]